MPLICLASTQLFQLGQFPQLGSLGGPEYGWIADLHNHPGIIGLAKQSDYITDLSFDILSLEALFLVPR